MNLPDESIIFSFSIKVSVSFNISGLCSSCGSVDDIFKAVGVLKELGIHNFIVLVTIYLSNGFCVVF